MHVLRFYRLSWITKEIRLVQQKESNHVKDKLPSIKNLSGDHVNFEPHGLCLTSRLFTFFLIN